MTGAAAHEPEDGRHIRRALQIAGNGWGRVAPNPMVGAVVVREGRVVGEGWHREYGGAHAEVEALERAGEMARGATLYVSLEPCSHTGKTPPCTNAIREAGIARLVFGARDPNPRAGGGGGQLQAAGLEVLGGVEEAAARSLDPAFFRAHDPAEPRRAWVELKLALSLDARIADHTGRSLWITGDEARAEVHRLRAGRDAIAVGIGTALNDDPSLTARGAPVPRVPPTRVVFDRRLRLPPESRLLATLDQAPLSIIASPDAPAAAEDRLARAGASVLRTNGLADAMEILLDRGIRSVFVEGGGGLASALLEEDLVDRLSFVYAPLFLGAGSVDPFARLTPPGLDRVRRWRSLGTRTFGPDTWITLER